MQYSAGALTKRQLQVLAIYKKFNQQNKHKMLQIPICKIQK